MKFTYTTPIPENLSEIWNPKSLSVSVAPHATAKFPHAAAKKKYAAAREKFAVAYPSYHIFIFII